MLVALLDFVVPIQCFPYSPSIFESQVSSLGARLASSWHFLIATHGLWCRRPLETQLCKSLLSYQSLPGGRAMARWWWVQCRVLATFQIWTTEIALFIQHYAVTVFFEFSLASFNLINFCWHLLVSNHVYHTAPGLYILRPIMVGQPQAHNRASGWDCGVKMGSGTLCAALRWYVHQWRWRVQHLFVGDLPERWFRRPETFKDAATSHMRPSRKTCKTHVCLVCLALS